MIFGVISGAYIETCVALIVYELSTPFLNKVLERSLHKIDNAVEMPETGMRYQDGQTEKVSLYDVEIGDILIVKPGETVSIPGTIDKGVSAISTYSNTSTYEPVVVKKAVMSAVVMSMWVKVSFMYRLMKLMKVLII